MTFKHKIYFVFYFIYAFLLDIRVGKNYVYYSKEKKKNIYCYIAYFSGVSSTNKIFGFDICVNFEEPTIGNCYKSYDSGSWTIKQFLNDFISYEDYLNKEIKKGTDKGMSKKS